MKYTISVLIFVAGGTEELTKLLAAARQQGFEEGESLAHKREIKGYSEGQKAGFELGKQAGRDEFQKELSEQEPVEIVSMGSAVLFFQGNKQFANRPTLIPRPTAPVKGE